MNGQPEIARAHRNAPAVPTEAELTRAFRSAPHRFVDIGHSRVAYWRFGHGPDLLFIHGWPLDAATFRRIVPVLAESFTCHLFDLPGVGQTESDDDAPIELVKHAASVRALVDAIGLGKYAVLAHDSGGFVARMLAADDKRVTRLVLGDTELPDHTPAMIIAFALLAKTPVATQILRAMLGSRFIRKSALGFGGCFEDDAYVEGSFYDLFIQPMLASKRGAARQLRLLQTLHKGTVERLPEVHRAIEVPVQLIWGTRDPFFPIDKAREMVSSFGGPTSFAEIPGAKVFPHEDHAPTFARIAKEFLLLN
jgi:pimeloyl-ACP methyl ester carboxylesterase